MDTKAITSNRTQLKKLMLEASIAKHQTVIEDFKLGIKEMMGSKNNINQDDIESSQPGLKSEVILRVNQLADQLQFANEEMKILYDMFPTCSTIHDQAQLGSVVVTDKGIFFVSVSIERFEVDDIQAFGLSEKSPLFKAMKGKRKGDTFTYDGKDIYHIKEVF